MEKHPVHRYLQTHEDIVRIVFYSVRACPYKSSVQWHNVLHKYIIDIIAKYGEILPLSKREVRQQLNLMWIEFAKEFNENNPKIHIKQYLIRRSIWAIRDWISKLCSQQFVPSHYVPTQEEDIVDWGFKLDINFLVFGSGWYPLSLLSPYERYLIFLKFAEDKSIVEISYIVQKDRLTVKKQLDEIVKDFRRRLNVDQEKSNGSCIRRSGSGRIHRSSGAESSGD